MRPHSKMLEQVARNIRYLRSQTSFLQSEVAETLGVDKSTLSRWESADTDPGVAGLAMLARFYDVSIDDLIYGEPKVGQDFNAIDDDPVDEDALNAAREYDALRAQQNKETI